MRLVWIYLRRHTICFCAVVVARLRLAAGRRTPADSAETRVTLAAAAVRECVDECGVELHAPAWSPPPIPRPFRPRPPLSASSGASAGSGLCALAALRAGAVSVLAADIDPLSLEAICLNAAANGANGHGRLRTVVEENAVCVT